MVFVFTGCGSKTALTADEFTSTAQDNGLTVSDVSEQYEAYGVYDSAIIAQSDDDWQVEFYVLTDEDNASDMFASNQEQFESAKKSSSTESSKSVGNYETYGLTSGGNYMYICRVDNTVLFVNASDDYKDDIKAFVETLGY
jgi:hypothetical protein